MNKAIKRRAWALFVLLCASSSSALAQHISTVEEENAQQALKLMQDPPVEGSGRNIWPALITWQQMGLTPEQRQAAADEYASQVERWYNQFVADYLDDKIEQTQPFPSFPGERKLPSARDSVLCGFATPVTDCLATVREQRQAISDALAPYADAIEQVAALFEYDYYHMPLPRHGNMRWPDFRFVRLPLSAHALTHIQGDSQAALVGLCRNAHTGRMLIGHSSDLLVSMVGRRMLVDSVEVAAQIIAELPLEATLPAICDRAFAPLSAQEISLCPAMRGEFALMRSYAELEKQRLERQQNPIGNEQPSDWDKALLVHAQHNSTMCLPQTQHALLKDEKFALPPLSASTWLTQQCNEDNPACHFAQQINGAAYVNYVHRMQDTAAQLHLMQVLLWLRKQTKPALTNDYLQAAIPADVYPRSQRVLKILDEPHALEIDAYDERASSNIRLALPKALLR